MVQGEPQPAGNYFRKKQNAELYTDTLDKLCRYARESEPMAYALYEDEIQSLYEGIWQKLEQLDIKSAKRFEPSLQATD